MDASKMAAPVKDQPHPFQAGPEIPIAGAKPAETITEGEVPHLPSPPNCALCGAQKGDQIHVEGVAEADAESPKWG